MSKKYIHITENERRRIERLLQVGESLRSIAKKLGRSPNSVGYEIKRNQVKGEYLARKAGHKRYVRRKYSKIQCLKVVKEKKLFDYVVERIKDDQSPELISGRLKNIDVRIAYASTKAIYKFVYSVYGRLIEKHLYSKAVKKRGGPKRPRVHWRDGRTMIDQRPGQVKKRRQFGHFELDFIESGKDGKGSLLVLIERKSRYPFLVYAADRTTETINKTVARLLKGVPARSITADNDLSLQKHKELSLLVGAAVFFCHPQSPQEKGTVENRNKLLRRYFPKRSDLSGFSLECIEQIEARLRRRPMKCLGFRAPEEVWEKEMRKCYQKAKIGKYVSMKTTSILSERDVLLQGCV